MEEQEIDQLSNLVSNTILENQHLLTKALFNAQLYIAELEAKLEYSREKPSSPKASDYYIAVELLFRSEMSYGLDTEKFPKPTFAPWYASGLLENIKPESLGSYQSLEEFLADEDQRSSANKEQQKNK